MNKVQPTQRQLKTLEIKQANPKMPLGKAMILAGYSEKVAKAPKQNFLERRGTEKALEEFNMRLAELGVTPTFYADKVHEWATATKIKSSLTEPDRVVPDYQTQLAVKEDLKEILGLKQDEGITRKLTIEEFIKQ